MQDQKPPRMFIIAGCNGAGKTTASFTILPEILQCNEFVNADEIARGLSPFQPESVAFEAGRIMLHRIDELLNERVDFAFETTLSTRSYTGRIKRAQAAGYKVQLIFFWLESIDLARKRVRKRVKNGGHHIPEDVIARRYVRGIDNLFTIYFDICDEVLVVDNTKGSLTIASKKGQDLSILNNALWENLNKHRSR